MQIHKSDLVTMWDVDDTLIWWDHKPSKSKKLISFELYGRVIQKYVVEEHVKELKLQKESGAFNVVWSASGYAWAEAIVRALELEDYVDVIMSKPLRIYDDKDPQDFMPKRRYNV